MPTEYLEPARHAVRSEHRRLDAEKEAFGAFLSRLDSLTPTSPSTLSPGSRSRHATVSTSALLPSGTRTAAIEEAYRETVMDIDHYGEDYGDTLRESISEEFGEEVTVALETETVVTPFLKSQLRQAPKQTATERKRFLETVDSEATVLDETV